MPLFVVTDKSTTREDLLYNSYNTHARTHMHTRTRADAHARIQITALHPKLSKLNKNEKREHSTYKPLEVHILDCADRSHGS